MAVRWRCPPERENSALADHGLISLYQNHRSHRAGCLAGSGFDPAHILVFQGYAYIYLR
jgi:hypothetical protein